MLFQGRVNRAMKHQHEEAEKRRKAYEAAHPEDAEKPVREETGAEEADRPETEGEAPQQELEPLPSPEELKEEATHKPLKERLEKHDLLAMLISAFLVILPAAVIALLLLLFLTRLFTGTL